MEIEFKTPEYDRLETDADFTNGFPVAIVRQYRFRIGFLRGALDERDIYKMKSWRFEKLKGDREHQHSIRLNDQYRLILELVAGDNGKICLIVRIEDYH